MTQEMKMYTILVTFSTKPSEMKITISWKWTSFLSKIRNKQGGNDRDVSSIANKKKYSKMPGSIWIVGFVYQMQNNIPYNLNKLIRIINKQYKVKDNNKKKEQFVSNKTWENYKIQVNNLLSKFQHPEETGYEQQGACYTTFLLQDLVVNATL